MLYNNQDFITIFGRDKCIFQSNFDITKVVFDSRLCEKDTLFIALSGGVRDGHTFIENAIQNGAICIICEYIPDNIKNNRQYSNINFIVIKNTLTALQDLARFQRERLKAKVIGITGNIGKTSTKECIRQVLSQFYKTYATEGNFNNDIGLPLMLANTPLDTEILILEMGTNHIGEIEFLTKIAKPDIAIITTIAPAHIGNFGSIEKIIEAKAEIFKGLTENGIAILNEENQYFTNLKDIAVKKGIKPANIKTIGVKTSDIFIKNHSFNEDYTTNYDVVAGNKEIKCKVQGLSYSKAFNTLFAIEIADLLGLDLQKVADIIAKIPIVKGRGNVEKYTYKSKNITIINDCYNSSPDALKSAIQSVGILQQQINNNQHQRVIAVIGDMLELGENSQKYHQQIANELLKNQIKTAIFVGKESKIAFDTLPNNYNKMYFSTTDDFINKIDDILENKDILMLKASHGLHFDKILEYLQK